ncbi:MAG TPA: DUF2917 domain-containing protein [Anaeromyxobacteraceae bacterium]|nr:DUF2917 domain-containing protein [Anaeromyxobacteraceae bacterium]
MTNERTTPGAELFLPDWSARSIDVRRRPVRVVCIDGEVLVTAEGDPEDHVLEPGTAFVADHSGRVVVTALRDSHVEVREAA